MTNFHLRYTGRYPLGLELQLKVSDALGLHPPISTLIPHGIGKNYIVSVKRCVVFI